MGFTKTSEGRVFFQNADNDEIGQKRKAISAANGSSPSADAVMPKDNTQIQILLLLKSLNTKLKSSKEDNSKLKKQLIEYKASIKSIEDKTQAQQENYIDLEQKVARKQSESSKKALHIEQNVKSKVEATLTQLEEAKELVKQLEKKSDSYDASLLGLKGQIAEQRKRELVVTKRQKAIETQQKDHNEKMVSSVATYVDLTKRVSETETRQESLDNKIDDAKSDYLKLDRKIDKALEDRNRILRKVERIEQAVIETRDALNAKAMVLLTDQGAVAGVDMPHIGDQDTYADPLAISQRLQEEAMLPWWRKPVRIQSTSLALMMLVVLLLGWIISSSQKNTPVYVNASVPNVPTVRVSGADTASYKAVESATALSEDYTPVELSIETAVETNTYTPLVEEQYSNFQPSAAPFTTDIEDNIQANVQNEDHGITIHKGLNENAHVHDDIQPIDINNEEQMLAVLEEDPDRLAARLNEIEPKSLTSEDKAEPSYNTKSAAQEKAKDALEAITRNISAQPQNNSEYKAALSKKIRPDYKLTDIAKKIEAQAFAGVPEAQHDMGAIYVSGHGTIPQDLDRAIFWFSEAANNGIANAKYNLGVLYHQGLGVQQNTANAIALYDEAADLNHPEAQYNLGIAYIEGIGVPYTPNKAAAYFEHAANNGVVEAAYNLGLIYENGLLGQTQPDLALSWYKYAADKGSPEAKSALDQLAASLGIEREDINRIVENMQKKHAISAQGSADQKTIANIQKQLMTRGLYPGPVDGMIGPKTRSAIETYQRSAGIMVSGEPTSDLLYILQSRSY